MLYVLSGLGVTVGFHRLLTHRAFKTTRPVLRAALAILGSAAIEGPGHLMGRPITASTTQFSDKAGDPA